MLSRQALLIQLSMIETYLQLLQEMAKLSMFDQDLITKAMHSVKVCQQMVKTR
jgi:hypothetical protein